MIFVFRLTSNFTNLMIAESHNDINGISKYLICHKRCLQKDVFEFDYFHEPVYIHVSLNKLYCKLIISVVM